MDSTFWIPILISIVAVSFSIFSTNKYWLSPFNPKFNIGTPLLGLAPVGLAPGRKDQSVLIPLVPIDIHNTGAKSGVIKDIMLVITVSEKSWTLQPHYFSDEFSISAATEKQPEVFHPIYLEGRGEVVKYIVFSPAAEREELKPPIFKQGEKGVSAGTYKFSLYASYGSNYQLSLVQEIRFLLPQDKADSISSGRAFIVPTSDEVIESRVKMEDDLLK